MAPRVRIANVPASWGALEFGLEGQVAPWSQVLDEIASTGYEGTELGDWGFLPTDPQQLTAELQCRSLQLVAAFVPIALSQRSAWPQGEKKALRTAHLLASAGGEQAFLVLADDNGTNPARTRYAGRTTPGMELDEPGWELFAQGAEHIARAVLKETGLRTVFHHHCGGYVETPAEIERLMSLTDPGLIGLCLDTGHCMFGGGDPLALLARYASRVWHVHLKDYDPAVAARGAREDWDYFQAVEHGIFCELGQGAVPFTGIREILTGARYEGWLVVEQDVLPSMGDPMASARRNREYLSRLGWA
jgi:inosose dehydratase